MDSGEEKSSQWTKRQAAHLAVHFAWKEKSSILIYGLWPVVWLDGQRLTGRKRNLVKICG